MSGSGQIDFSSEGEPEGKPPMGEVETTRRSNVVAGLEARDHENELAFHEIVTAKFIIGRSPDCNLCITGDTKTSRKHACIKQTPVGYSIEDMGSSNGTFVNDQKIKGVTELKVDDQILIGKQNFVFKISLGE
ncbi:MAG: FHA domain-containing protein [Planctomycetota bacterium]